MKIKSILGVTAFTVVMLTACGTNQTSNTIEDTATEITTDVETPLETENAGQKFTTFFTADGNQLVLEIDKGDKITWSYIDYKKYSESCDAGSSYFSFIDDKNGYILCCSTPGLGQMTKLLFATNDGGQSFEFVNDMTDFIKGYSTGITFVNEKEGYITVSYHGQDEYLYKTLDGGFTWQNVEVKIPNLNVNYIESGLPVFYKKDTQKGMLVLRLVSDSTKFMLCTTSDGGENWKVQGELNCDSVSGYEYVDEEQFNIADNEGRITTYNFADIMSEETTEDVKYVETVKITSPSKESYISDNAIKTSATPIEITEISKTPNEIIDTEKWFIYFDLSYPEMGGDDDYRYDVDLNWDSSTSSYKTFNLTIYDEVKGNKEYNLDFSDFCYTNSDYFEQREIQWVAYRDNVLYVSIWHNGYAEPDSCYIIAINLDTMEVLWKSDSLVSNANNFILFDDVIMCAYGFTAEPDYIYQLDINTGETIDKYLLKTKADYLILKDNELYVRCYDTDYVFKVNE